MKSTRWILPLGATLLAFGALCGAAQFFFASNPVKALLTAVSVAAAGVGGSLIAGVIALRFASEIFLGVDLTATLEVLKRTSRLTRSKQRLTITLRRNDEGGIRLDAYHSFDITCASHRGGDVVFEMFTDVSRWATNGGFQSLKQPIGPELRASDGSIDEWITEVGGKPRFAKSYALRASQAYTVDSHTYGDFRLTDRLVWTVEHLSDNFEVELLDHTGHGSANLQIKINHHREPEILEALTWTDDTVRFNFLGTVLPYQGFELSWKCAPVTPVS